MNEKNRNPRHYTSRQEANTMSIKKQSAASKQANNIQQHRKVPSVTSSGVCATCVSTSLASRVVLSNHLPSNLRLVSDWPAESEPCDVADHKVSPNHIRGSQLQELLAPIGVPGS